MIAALAIAACLGLLVGFTAGLMVGPCYARWFDPSG